MVAPNTRQKVVDDTGYADASALLEALDPRSGVLSGSGWVFRGQSDARWRLHPAALRRDAWVTLGGVGVVLPRVADLFDQIENELRAVWTFAREADRQGLHVPGFADLVVLDDRRLREQLSSLLYDGLEKGLAFPPAELEAMFGMAQHYGIPTRLLDWSESPYVAAYFAALEAARELHFNPRLSRRMLRIWALDTDRLWQLEPSRRWGQVRIVRAPWATNPNLRAQRGLFTVHRHIYKWGKGARMSFGERVTAPLGADVRIIPIPRPRPLDEVLNGLWGVAPESIRELYLTTPPMRSFRLRWTQAPRLLQELERIGVSAASLFPGYEGAARGLKERRFQGPHQAFRSPDPGLSI